MASVPRRDTHFQPEEQDLIIDSSNTENAHQRRMADIYDAVAGRVSVKKNHVNDSSEGSKRYARDRQALYPEEALFRQRRAPYRWQERPDFYWADQNLPASCPLPDTDLLKAIHAYTADFYDRATQDRGSLDTKSMDETALLALGILLEEAAGHMLGETGDMALVEGEPIDTQVEKPQNVSSSRTKSSSRESSLSQGLVEKNGHKRRKLND